jgi:endonuclease YncB( thermonuclease family)
MVQKIAGTLLHRLDPHLLVIAAVIIGAVIFIAASMLGRLGIQVMDGDGPVICDEQDQQGRQVQVRLRGIEARDGDGNCRLAQGCPAMNWLEAKAVLTRVAGARMNCVAQDAYRDRVDAFCSTLAGIDVACELVKMGAAVRWPEFDPEGRLLRCIPGRRN